MYPGHADQLPHDLIRRLFEERAEQWRSGAGADEHHVAGVQVVERHRLDPHPAADPRGPAAGDREADRGERVGGDLQRVVVVDGGRLVFERAYGMADLSFGIRQTVDTPTNIGSVTKQFTAAAILQLRDAGRLGLDDPITDWLPEFEGRGDGVTLRHLITHTAGIPEFG